MLHAADLSGPVAAARSSVMASGANRSAGDEIGAIPAASEADRDGARGTLPGDGRNAADGPAGATAEQASPHGHFGSISTVRPIRKWVRDQGWSKGLPDRNISAGVRRTESPEQPRTSSPRGTSIGANAALYAMEDTVIVAHFLAPSSGLSP